MHVFVSLVKFWEFFFYNFNKLATVFFQCYSLKKAVKNFNSTIIALRNQIVIVIK